MHRKRTARAVLTVALALTASLAAGTGSASADPPAVGSGTGVYVGQVPLTTTRSAATYLLQDPTRGNTSTSDARAGIVTDADNVWGNGLATNRQSAAVDAQFTAVAMWDYLKLTFSRVGLANDGRPIRSVVHYGSNYGNAFWSDACGCVTYGDGAGNTRPVTELDIGAHELAHGLTSATAGLGFTGEAGALNEATSDIFATLVEFSANLPADVPDYFIGEKADLFGDGTPVRYLDRPSRDGSSPDFWSPAVAGMDPGAGSGVGDHFFYLLAEGSGRKVINGISYASPTADGSSVTGIGRAAAAAIWYRALTVYLASDATYHSARAATLSAAGDLYGKGSAEYAAVGAAWTGVDVA
ncbi:M4 family metallopeptidase [Actinacidiphila sp. ITFR-21]|uniref:M4 family metallopeptidase n=1 Tax=Actinacidiphila sp. ITFR-21 TaxID=3075199 RepID=UPI00288C4774|nr:M4 family metallopeptidase [Streptomyces sp. ITFR-21]WNI17103.1 M4 family metallopeptidase [Streptomyces sp. ITFR-21]